MVVAIIVTILFCSALSDWARAEDWETSERNAERRHRELINTIETNRKPVKKHKEEKYLQRRAIKDSYGRVLVEEVLLDSIEDLSEYRT